MKSPRKVLERVGNMRAGHESRPDRAHHASLGNPTFPHTHSAGGAAAVDQIVPRERGHHQTQVAADVAVVCVTIHSLLPNAAPGVEAEVGKHWVPNGLTGCWVYYCEGNHSMGPLAAKEGVEIHA